ncbi:MAG TPA: protein-disulfide reductase DsbD domain-containing protein, partial [Rhizomicrobium sp.]|nr:protein-disulfide reductase DsbD domain-containing protein [Rhizomicrobium sp.]
MNRIFGIAALLLAFAAPALAQDEDRSDRVAARLIAEQASAKPGGHVTIALEQVIRPKWHTYWVNAGDVGQATSIDWTLPAGWKAGDIQWPAPKQLPVGPFMDYGYEGKVWLLADVAVPADAKIGDTVPVKATAHFLVCEQVCVPQDTDLSLNMKVGDGAPDPAVAQDFAAARAALPVASPWKLNYALSGGHLDLYAAASALAAAHPVEAVFFPLKPGVVKGTVPQQMGFSQDGLVLRLTPADKLQSVGSTLDGVLVMKSSDGSVQALSVNAPAGPVPPVSFSGASAGAAEADITLWLAILFAFIGGLILNAMPCVLPILAMKALALAGHAGKHKHEAAMEGFAYAAGAILSFLVFGLVIVALRQGGEAVGWGFQLQNPVAVAGFALLVFLVGLNRSGLFEFGTVTAGESLTAKSGWVGPFFTGVLAVAVAAPCTAPFMAAALGFALSQSAVLAMLIFLALGLGFALPFLILGFWPRALSFLPKPGPWMLRLKQFLAFPMYGAAVWLAWVLAQEAGANAVAVLLSAFVGTALAAWLWSITRDLETRGRLTGAGVAGVILVAALYGLSTLSGASAPPPSAAIAGEKFSPEKLASYRAAGKPVFVDATAAWCITCLVNEQAVLSRASVKDAFNQKQVAYMVADWTNRDAAITKLLDDNGRSGVPLYLYYAPGSDKPVILPQILT